MLSLRELQTEFRRAILGQGETSVALRNAVAHDPFAEERLAIYRNNVLASLTAVLRDTFPVVCRLVPRFPNTAPHSRFFSGVFHPAETSSISPTWPGWNGS